MGDISFLRVVLATALAITCSAIGIIASGGRRAHFLAPVSGGLLIAIALFALIPEAAQEIGWALALATAAAGYALLEIVDRLGLPVCPSCSHSHGFSWPLVAATAVHAFVDGWGMMAFANAASPEASRLIVGALLLHKIPEGLALGAILRISAPKPWRAAGLAILAESPTLAGGLVGLWWAQTEWLNYPIALVAGVYSFLGIHAVRAWMRPGHLHESMQ